MALWKSNLDLSLSLKVTLAKDLERHSLWLQTFWTMRKKDERKESKLSMDGEDQRMGKVNNKKLQEKEDFWKWLKGETDQVWALENER